VEDFIVNNFESDDDAPNDKARLRTK
jgi:hypothetical protein